MIISWNTTQQCNIGCLHCYRDAGKAAQNELTTQEGKKLLAEIARAGFKIMIFSGGEPLMRKDICELVATASALGMRPVIGTNGILLSEKLAADLKKAGLMAVGISMDSTSSQNHDWFRGCQGAWQQTMDGINACRRAGLPFQIHTTVLNWNKDEIEKLTDLAVEWGAIAHHIFFLVPTGRGKDIEETTLKTLEYEKLIGAILAKQKQVPIELKPTCAPQFMRIAKQQNIPMRYTRGCLAGTTYCVILPNGNVQPCAYLPVQAGNVREKEFDKIWQESLVFQNLRQEPLKGSCGQCSYNNICGGCRARAYYYSDGDYLAEEPWCIFSK
jgi:putative heme d1 biosynthesis radical SAM protein NirJ2